MGKNLVQRVKNAGKNAGNKARSAAFLAGLAGACILSSAGNAKGLVVRDFDELFSLGYSTQSINNNANGNFSVEGNTPVLKYNFAFLNSDGYVVGDLENYSQEGYKNYAYGNYIGTSIPGQNPVDALVIGEKPTSVIGVEDTNANGIIGNLENGIFYIDNGDRAFFKSDIIFNGIRGDLSQMPAYTGVGGQSLTIPSINISTNYVFGDANADGITDSQDFTILKAGFGQSGNWNTGDFNCDGIVDTGDFTLLKTNFGNSLSLPATDVLEPTTTSLILLGGLGVVNQKRRR